MANRYWIAPSAGKWSNTANWSDTNGGTGGASVPTGADIVTINRNTTVCIIDVPATADKILVTNGTLITLAPLTCNSIEWGGDKLFLANSQIQTLSVKRTQSRGSSLYFDSYYGESLENIKPLLLTWIGKGATMDFAWKAVSGASGYYLRYAQATGGFTNMNGGAIISSIPYNSTTTNLKPGSFVEGRSNLTASWIDRIYTDDSVNNFSISHSDIWSGLGTVSTTPQPLYIGTLNVESGSNPITIQNNAETRLTGDVTIPNGITVTQSPGSKWTLFGTQDQVISTSISDLGFSLNKSAGKVSFSGSVNLQSDLLRSSGEIDPRTATLLDMEADKVQLTGDVACRSYKGTGVSPTTTVTIPSGITLDTYSFYASGDVAGNGIIRVHTGQYTAVSQFGGTVDYWDELNPPTSISASAFSSTGIFVTVGYSNATPLAASLVIERSLTGSSQWQTICTEMYQNLASLGDSTGTTWYDSNLVAGTKYYYRARFVLGSDTSGYTLIVHATTQGGVTPPVTPNQIFVTDQRATEMDLWWNVINGATSYVLERTTNYGNPNSWVQVHNGSATTCTDTSLTPGTLYYYRLKAVNAGGDSNWSPMLAVATATWPAPSNLVVSKVTATSIALQWKSQYGPVDHLVAWSPNGTDSWTEIQTASQSSFVLTGLTPEAMYDFRVRARYVGSHSPWSAIVSATTLPIPQPVNTSETWSVIKRISQSFEVKTSVFGEKL